MAVDDTLLMREVGAIIDQGQSLSHYRMQCRIRVNRQWLTPLQLALYAVERDYEQNFGEVVVIEVLLGKGTYAYQLYPHRDALQVEITSVPLIEASGDERRDGERNVRRYRAVLINQDNPGGITGREPQASDAEDLDRTGVMQVQLQLIDEGLYQARMMTVGRLYRQTTPMTVLRSLLTETLAFVDANNQQRIEGVEVASGYNESSRSHIIIPHGTLLTEVPALLQEEEGGLYGGGIACFLQRKHWYVFPPYNTERFKKAQRRLTLLNIPPNRYYGGERTYRVAGKNIVAICAGDMDSRDEGFHDQLNRGNAVRFTDASQILTGFSDVTGNRARVSRESNLFEFEGDAIEGGYSHARWGQQRASSNPFPQYAAMARRQGRYAILEWLHGDISLLTPGMPVRYLVNQNGTLTTYEGVLLGANEQRAPRDGGVDNHEYPATLRLKVFLQRQD